MTSKMIYGHLCRLGLLVLVAICGAVKYGLAADQRPNVLFIVSDDLNNSLGCYGDPIVKTPSLDRLAAKGVRFDHAYCQSPLCNPSRVSFLSGLNPDHTGVYLLATPTRTHLPGAEMLPACFRRNGYFTVQNGKIFHTGEGFEDPQSWTVANFEFGKSPLASEVIESGNPPGPIGNSINWAALKTRDEDTPDGIVARRAVQYMVEARTKGQPFFLGVGFRRPHAPYAAPKKYFDLYPADKTPLPAAVPDGYARSILPAALNHPWGLRPLTDPEQKEVRSAYFACISFVDAQVGVLLDALDRFDLWQNTIVVFVSDHGYHLGEHGGLWHKKSLFEEACRVPLIVYAPNRKGSGKACAQFVELIDLYPTLIELCGFKSAAQLDGKSFARLLDTPMEGGKDAAFSLIARGEDSSENLRSVSYLGRTLRTERWRYTEWDDGKRGVELYDHEADPRELHNLANSPQHAGTVLDLHRRLAQYERGNSAHDKN